MKTPETFGAYQALLCDYRRTGLNPKGLRGEQACEIMERLDGFERTYFPQTREYDYVDLSRKNQHRPDEYLVVELRQLQGMFNPRLGRKASHP